MNATDVIRAWKDESFRAGLSAEQRAQMPENPAGTMELTEQDLVETEGGSFAYASSNGTSGGTQCTAHGCGNLFNLTIRINPGWRR